MSTFKSKLNQHKLKNPWLTKQNLVSVRFVSRPPKGRGLVADSVRRLTAMARFVWRIFNAEWRSGHRLSWVMIGVAIILVTLVISSIELGLMRRALYPVADQRHDVDHIFMGSYDDLCAAWAKTPNRSSFAACSATLKPQSMIRVDIPTFDEIHDQSRSFTTILKQHPQSKQLMELLREGHYYVIGIPLPSDQFTVERDPVQRIEGHDGKINLYVPDDLADYGVLTFRGMRYGKVCIDGICHHETTEKLSNFNHFPLRLSQPTTDKTTYVWVFALETQNPIGIQLDEGIMTAKAGDLMAALKFYGMYRYGASMRGAIWFCALFLVSLVFAITHRRFPDYPALAYLAASFALWLGMLYVGILYPSLRMEAYQSVKFWVWCNLVIASVTLVLSIVRYRPRHRIDSVFSMAHGAVLVITVVLAVTLEMPQWQALWLPFTVVHAVVFIAAVLSLLIVSIRSLTPLARDHELTPRYSQRLDYRRRVRELWIHGLIWTGFFANYLAFIRRGFTSGNITEFSSYGVALFTAMIGVMLYFTHSKQKTRMLFEPVAELDRLRDRLSEEAFSQSLTRPRQDLMIIPDLGGSSDKDGRVKDELMFKLRDKALEDLARAGRYVDLINTGGDDWKIVPSRLDEDWRRDLVLIIGEVKAAYPAWLDLVQHHFPTCNLHLSLYALPDNFISLGRGANGLRTDLSFSSRAANLFLKFADKPKVPGTMLIGAPRSIFPIAELEGALVSWRGRSLHAMTEVVEAAHGKAIYLELAKELDLVIAHVSLSGEARVLDEVAEAGQDSGPIAAFGGY